MIFFLIVFVSLLPIGICAMPLPPQVKLDVSGVLTCPAGRYEQEAQEFVQALNEHSIEQLRVDSSMKRKLGLLAEDDAYAPILDQYQERGGFLGVPGFGLGTLAHRAASENAVKNLRLVVQSRSDIVRESDREGLIPLLCACRAGAFDAYSYLVTQWPDSIYSADDHGFGPLHWVVQYGELQKNQYDFEPKKDLIKARVAIINNLLARGAQKTARTPHGKSPFDIADHVYQTLKKELRRWPNYGSSATEHTNYYERSSWKDALEDWERVYREEILPSLVH